VAVVLLGASLLTLGVPDLGLAGQFLGGAYPSPASALAFLSITFDLALVGAACVAFVGAGRDRGGRRGLPPTVRAVAFVLAGAILLGMGIAQRVDTGGGFCCGNGPQQVREAESLAR
jgi:hypothetical protein